MITVSFCLIFYNQEKFIQDSMDSILSMNLPFDYEILVGDDGSNDNTVNIVKKYQKSYPGKIKLFIMPRKKGKKYNPIERASANRLNLVKESQGKYISFLDGDDYFCDKHFVNQAVQILEKDKSLITCMGNYQHVYSNGTTKVIRNKLPVGVITPSVYISTTYLPAGCGVFRNIWCNTNKYDKSLKDIFDDNVITLYLLQYGAMYHMDKVVYSYRQLQTSIWNTANITEQNILNALDYEVLCSLLPKYKHSILKRQFSSIKYLYKNKHKIQMLLDAEKYNKYLQQSKDDFFVHGCINYHNLSFKQKIELLVFYNKLKRGYKHD